MAQDPLLLGQQFAAYFYQLFQTDREQLASLFVDSSTMTFEGQCLKGKSEIMAKLLSLPKNIQRVLTTVDCQPLDDTFFLVFLLGQLQAETIGQSFAKYYYETFDSDRSKLESVYVDVSLMQFEGKCFQGKDAIMKLLKDLPGTKFQHVLTTVDSQKTAADPSTIVVFVNGEFKIDDDMPRGFGQTFLLKANDKGEMCILNAMLRVHLQHQ